MAVMSGCADSSKTPVMKEVKCPQCGDDIEIYTMQARMIEDAECGCGYVLKADDYNTAGQKPKAEE